MLRVALALVGLGHAEAYPVASCEQQSKCLMWTIRLLPPSHNNCGGDCQYEVCALVDTVQCKGSDQAAIDTACVVGDQLCGSDITAAFDEWGTVRLGHQNRVCQVGLGGTTLSFPMNDGAHCTAPLDVITADDAQVSCAPRTASDPTCSPDVIDCVWKVALPACTSGALRSALLPSLAVAGTALLTRLVLRHWLRRGQISADDTSKGPKELGPPHQPSQPKHQGVGGAHNQDSLPDSPTLEHSSSQGTMEAVSV